MGSVLLHTRTASNPVIPTEQLPLQAAPAKIHQLALAMSYVGVTLVTSIQGCILRNQPRSKETSHMLDSVS